MSSNISHITLFCIGVILFSVTLNINGNKTYDTGIIESDGKGYYAYLPAIFIYQDLNFSFFDAIEKTNNEEANFYYYDYRANGNGKTINKDYCGTAVAIAPFFLISHGLTYFTDYEKNGYSKLYTSSVKFAAIFYLLLGLFFINKLLQSYSINEKTSVFTLLCITFGTHLFYYTITEHSMSHVYSFAFISAFCYYGKNYFSTPSTRTGILLSFTLGMILLIRPINGLIVLLLPFLAGEYNIVKSGISHYFQQKSLLIGSLLTCFLIVSVQLIIYKVATGNFLVYSYQSEGFDFLHPHLFDILFSYRKGLFLYTPILFISLVGGKFLWQKNRFSFFTLFGFLFLLTYIFSSWWMWSYGGSFSSRVFVEYLPVFAILLAIAIHSIKQKTLKRAYVTTVILLIVVCQIQTFQYRYNHIHWDEMTKEKYWDVFLRVDRLL